MNSYKVKVNGNDIQIVDYAGEKDPILAIHGLTGSHKNMHYYAEKLKGEYRFITVDLRGRGNSSETDPDTSIFKHAEDILVLIEELKLENPILLGYSMGAFISAIVASRLESIQALILLDGAAKTSEHQRSIIQPSLGRLSRHFDSKEHYVEEIKKIYSNLGIEWTEVLRDTVEYEVAQAGVHWENKAEESRIVADFNSFYTFNPVEIGAKINCPTLLVYAEGGIGSMPPLFYLDDYKEIQASIGHIETVVSDSNHYTMVFEQRDDIQKALDGFLEKL